MRSVQPLLVLQIAAAKLPHPVQEYRFAPPRRWRFDVAFLEHKLAVEIDGGGFVQGRHSRGTGMEKDNEKMAAALIDGWRVLRVTPRQVTSGLAIGWIEQLVRAKA